MDDAAFTLKLNERDEVIIIPGSERLNLGPKQIACEEMLRFTRSISIQQSSGGTTSIGRGH